MAKLTTYWNLVAAAALLLAACGTIAPDGGGASHLPVSGAGPYARLAPNEDTAIDEPTVLGKASYDLDAPMALVRGEQIGLWYTRTGQDGRSVIEHADFDPLEDGVYENKFFTFVPSLDWAGPSAAEPSVLMPEREDEPWVLFFAANGAIGWATTDFADNGHTWKEAPQAALSPTGDEGPRLSSPAAMVLDGADGKIVRLFYLAQGGLRAADAKLADVAARTPGIFQRRPGLVVADGAAPWLPAVGRTTARTVVTVDGRARHELFLSGETPDRKRTVGMAASWDADAFEVAQAPFLGGPAEAWAPTVIAFRQGSLLLFAQAGAGHTVIAGATSP